jgi:hypothetical protein
MTMKKPKNAKPVASQYSVEIMTASRDGLQAFVNKLNAIRAAHPVTRRLGRDGDGGLVGARIAAKGALFKGVKDIPMSSGGIGQFIGPLNRTVIPARVTEYRWAMWNGNWWFTPDPVVVTDEGAIINGQHRLMAAEELLHDDMEEENRARVRSKGKPEERAEARAKLTKIRARQYPQFVIVWNVDKRAAILMDEARRSATDRRDIAIRYAAAGR